MGCGGPECQVIADDVGPVTSLAYHRGALFLASVQRGFLRIANHPDAQPVDINVPLGPMPIVNVSGHQVFLHSDRVYSVDDWTTGQLEQLVDLKPDGPVLGFAHGILLPVPAEDGTTHFQLKLSAHTRCSRAVMAVPQDGSQLSVQEAAAGGPGWLMTGFGRTRLFGEDLEAAGGFVAAWTQAGLGRDKWLLTAESDVVIRRLVALGDGSVVVSGYACRGIEGPCTLRIRETNGTQVESQIPMGIGRGQGNAFVLALVPGAPARLVAKGRGDCDDARCTVDVAALHAVNGLLVATLRHRSTGVDDTARCRRAACLCDWWD